LLWVEVVSTDTHQRS